MKQCKKFNECDKVIKLWNIMTNTIYPGDIVYMFPAFETVLNELCSKCEGYE